ncbi:C40 family peptidase [Lactobacillus sp. ESL0791]|uniref:C40 family peptidase n=1 Tax=Lactobacillus sp. ESL0791 TaxID=2983234 RepID=UPI0023F718AE|nr:C40 family peptidase [Lactobacillus sp. ESL0791]MDF7638533.1 C40 family peptidase [Lactobacillus sp. ESL0791]
MKHQHCLLKLITFFSLVFVGITVTDFSVGNGVQQVDAAELSKKEQRAAIVELAKQQLGKNYVYGSTGPNAFDCSGLVQYVYDNACNKALPRTTYTQVSAGKKVSLKNLKKGDLLFWGPASAPTHVGICIGNNEFIHAAASGEGVIKQKISQYFYPSLAERIID